MRSRPFKHVLSFVGYVSMTLLIYLVLQIEGDQLINLGVTVSPEMQYEEWMAHFYYWGSGVVFVTASASLLWYIWMQWFYKFDRPSSASPLRIYWTITGFIPFMFAAFAMARTPTVATGGHWVLVFYLVDAVLQFYLTTLFFSPSSAKYVPPLAASLRPRFW